VPVEQTKNATTMPVEVVSNVEDNKEPLPRTKRVNAAANTPVEIKTTGETDEQKERGGKPNKKTRKRKTNNRRKSSRRRRK
jgi:hypothetical protein